MPRYPVGRRASRSPRSSPLLRCGGRPGQALSSGCWRRERAGTAVRSSSWFSARAGRPTAATWLRVRLPGRPNGSAGWIPRDAVLVHHVHWWIDVSLSLRTVRVFRDGTLVRRFEAVVGAARTPTPVGLFAVYELDAQPDRGGFRRALGPPADRVLGRARQLRRRPGSRRDPRPGRCEPGGPSRHGALARLRPHRQPRCHVARTHGRARNARADSFLTRADERDEAVVDDGQPARRQRGSQDRREQDRDRAARSERRSCVARGGSESRGRWRAVRRSQHDDGGSAHRAGGFEREDQIEPDEHQHGDRDRARVLQVETEDVEREEVARDDTEARGRAGGKREARRGRAGSPRASSARSLGRARGRSPGCRS